jgi:predicted metal-dependent peptidase
MYDLAKDFELSRIVRARSRLGSKAPGYAGIVFGLELIEKFSLKTMATDGKAIYWNREFVKRCSDKELVAVLLHEGLHVTLGHHLRRGGTDPKLWNIACDYAINLVVKDANELLPAKALLDEKYRGFTAHQIVKLLGKPTPPPPPPPPPGESCEDGEPGLSNEPGDQPSDSPGEQPGEDAGEDADEDAGEQPDEENAPGQPGDFEAAGEIWDATDENGDELSKEARNEAEEELRRDVIVAAAAEKLAGTGSITIDGGILSSAKEAAVDWIEALADWLDKAYGQEPTLAKPARRHLWRGDYFPSLKGIGGGDLVIAIDTSGSVSQREAERFAIEIDGIRETIKPDRTCVIYCDSRIQKGKDGQLYDEFDSYDDIEVRDIRGGGTRFDPPFHLVDQEGLTPSAFIYFTDGYACVQERTADVVDYPVLWATTGVEPTFNGERFGEILEVEV